MGADPRDVERLFLELVDLPAGERQAALKERCADDAALREEVQALLEADEHNTDGLLEVPAHDGGEDEAPLRVAGYRILSRIGQGGMGTVYKAEQESPRRTVALKLIRPGYASRRMLRRFEFEADLLGRLQHPGIAQIYEAGIGRVEYESSAGDRPFIAMELVEGTTLLEYVRSADLDARRILELVVRVCDAVHHAHQAGVMHRDLKPGNVLVDGQGLPRVVDFGAARLTDGDVFSRSVQTATGQVVGTLQYMSPEQAAGDASKIDLRSDVYSLGVILYELLAGRPPIDLTGVPITEAFRRLHEAEPTRLDGVVPSLRGDVATIVHTALERDRERRYPSASELGADLRRYLTDLPIQARPPTTLYQLRKFARRNRPLAGALIAVALALIAGLISSLVLKARSDENAALAQRRSEDLLRLAAFQRLEDLTVEADELWPAHPENVERFEAWLARARALVAGLDASPDDGYLGHRAQLAKLEAASRGEGEDAADDRWWRSQLAKLVAALEDFDRTLLAEDGATPENGWSVRKRLTLAAELQAEFGAGGRHAAAWADALPAIRAAYDDPSLGPQMGLVPIGPDPDTGLWEFAHLATGDVSERGDDGRLAVDEDTGLVFVLLPGGTFAMGAQSDDPALPNYDPRAKRDEGPVRAVTVSPFFLSKYELSQAQWARLTGENPSYFRPDNHDKVAPTNPVEQVRWTECVEVCRRLQLVLPSEARWEYAARGGTSTAWWTGDERDSLVEHRAANLADRTARLQGATWSTIDDWPELNDGFGPHAPVDALAPNPFGLHHVHGNVWEWCLDAYAAYAAGDATDPVVSTGEDTRVGRGGSFQQQAFLARSSARGQNDPALNFLTIGLRPARDIDP